MTSCTCVGGRGGVKVLKSNGIGGRKLTEGWIKKEVGGKKKKEKERKLYMPYINLRKLNGEQGMV